jgi:phosphatidylinositol glycan class V
MYAGKLLRLFLVVKGLSLLLALFSARFLYPYNSHTDLLLSNAGSTDILNIVLAPFARWDSAYFLQIAMHGYEFENQHAFFPMFPAMMRMGAECLKCIGVPMLTGCLLVGVLLANICHFFTIVNIFRLTLTLGADEYFAFVSAAFATLSVAYPFQTAL